MTYLDRVADAIKAEVPDGILPKDNPAALFRLYAVLALAKGTSVTGADVHNAWSAWMSEIHPDHEALVPFDELDEPTRREDRPFVEAIRTVGRGLA